MVFLTIKCCLKFNFFFQPILSLPNTNTDTQSIVLFYVQRLRWNKIVLTDNGDIYRTEHRLDSLYLIKWRIIIIMMMKRVEIANNWSYFNLFNPPYYGRNQRMEEYIEKIKIINFSLLIFLIIIISWCWTKQKKKSKKTDNGITTNQATILIDWWLWMKDCELNLKLIEISF